MSIAHRCLSAGSVFFRRAQPAALHPVVDNPGPAPSADGCGRLSSAAWEGLYLATEESSEGPSGGQRPR